MRLTYFQFSSGTVRAAAHLPPSDSRQMPAREYDLVVWGATGFTGSLMCKHLAQHAPPDLRWAIAGRRAGALQKIVAELSSLPSTRCPPGGFKVADAVAAAADAAGDQADAVRKMVASTRVVLAAAGPFPVYSRLVLEACAAAGTHYVDITGEVVPYVRDSVHALHEQARQTGAKIVHCAGYDSMPSDMLSLLAIDALRAAGEQCSRCIIGCVRLDAVRSPATTCNRTEPTESSSLCADLPVSTRRLSGRRC